MRKPKSDHCKLLLVGLLACLAAAACSPSATEKKSSLKSFETELVAWPGILIKGEPAPSLNLAERMVLYNTPGVSVALIRNFQVVYAEGYGSTKKDGGVPVTSHTIFQAASISKPVAAAAALRLVEKGELFLDEDANTRLVSWKIPENEHTSTEKVTLRRILNHSAGLTVHGFPGYRKEKTVPTTVQILDGLKPANTAPIRVDTPPGRIWRYSGGGYTVMQLLLTDVLQQDFPSIMRDMVLDPVGMNDSTYEQPLPESRTEKAASAHFTNGKTIPGEWHTYPEMAAAGLWTTPTDLALFVISLMKARRGESNPLFSEETARQMLTVEKGTYGLGLSLKGEGNHFSFSHGGSNAGFKCTMIGFPEKGEGAVIMTNGDLGSYLMTEILYSISARFGWNDFKPTVKEPLPLVSNVLEGYTGTYQFNKVRSLTVTLEGGRLIADPVQYLPHKKGPCPFYPETESRFFTPAGDIKLNFIKDDTNQISGLEMTLNGRTSKADKL
jgi:CubicO group peptidase (beta-lactamase class C family)